MVGAFIFPAQPVLMHLGLTSVATAKKMPNSRDIKSKVDGCIQTGLMSQLNMEPLMSRGLMDVQ